MRGSIFSSLMLVEIVLPAFIVLDLVQIHQTCGSPQTGVLLLPRIDISPNGKILHFAEYKFDISPNRRNVYSIKCQFCSLELTFHRIEEMAIFGEMSNLDS